MKKTIFICLAVIIAILLFIFSCLVASSDGQGAILFIFTFPVITLLLVFANFLSRKARLEGDTTFKKIVYWASRVTLTFTSAFLVFAFIPGLNVFSKSVMSGVSFVFKSITGQSPYAWIRAKNHISVKISKALKDSNGLKLDLREISTSNRWDKVCIFGPYTSDESAAAVLQLSYDWKLSKNSHVLNSDDVSVLVFLYEDKYRAISYVTDLKRNEADFSKFSGQCFRKTEANFTKIPGESTEFQKENLVE